MLGQEHPLDTHRNPSNFDAESTAKAASCLPNPARIPLTIRAETPLPSYPAEQPSFPPPASPSPAPTARIAPRRTHPRGRKGKGKGGGTDPRDTHLGRAAGGGTGRAAATGGRAARAADAPCGSGGGKGEEEEATRREEEDEAKEWKEKGGITRGPLKKIVILRVFLKKFSDTERYCFKFFMPSIPLLSVLALKTSL